MYEANQEANKNNFAYTASAGLIDFGINSLL